jgi:hypothetical protein
VAVFNFYNVLTDKNAHHHVAGGEIEHVVGRQNTLFYPSDDDHPSIDGSRKATEEFIPLLNVFYHAWQEGVRANPPKDVPLEQPEQPAVGTPALPPQGEPSLPVPVIPGSLMIDNFDAGAPTGADSWEVFWDEAAPTTLACEVDTQYALGGNQSYKIDFNIAANSWGSCNLFYSQPQDWSANEGIIFYLRAAASGLIFNVDIYAGPADNRETYLFTLETQPDSTQDWMPVSLAWGDFHRADWEADAGMPFNKPAEITGIAFGFTTYPDTPNVGTIWIDEIALFGGNVQAPADIPAAPEIVPTQDAAAAEQPALSEPTNAPPPTAAPEAGGRGRLCGGAMAMPVVLLAFYWWAKKRDHVLS